MPETRDLVEDGPGSTRDVPFVRCGSKAGFTQKAAEVRNVDINLRFYTPDKTFEETQKRNGRSGVVDPSKGETFSKEATMKLTRVLVVLTLFNLGLTIFLLAQVYRVQATGPAISASDNVTPVLRGRELEIVDDQGKVRASIKIHAGDPVYKWPDGKVGYPETVMLRLIDPNGRPEVKMGASVEGGGLGLVGGTDSTQLTLKADGPDTSIKLQNKAGKQQMIKP